MGWIISIAVAFIVCGAIFFVGTVITRESAPDTPGKLRGLLVRVGAIVLLVLWILVHTALVSIKQVEAGHVAVVYEFGEIVGQKEEGLQFIAPWQSTRTASVQTQRRTFSEINAFSAETQDVFITATLNYSVSPGDIQQLYRSIGPNWFERLVEARVNNFFKEEAVRFSTVDIAPNRETLRTAVRERLRSDLAPQSITITDLLIDNINFQPEFKTAIEQKQIATQDAIREEERIRQREAEARQEVALAQGSAQAVVIAAQAQSEANNLLAQSLTPEVIQFQALQKLADDIQIALLPAGQGLIIDPSTFLGSLEE